MEAKPLSPATFEFVLGACKGSGKSLGEIAAGANIPLSILMGTPKGARESSQKDRKDYADFLTGIQKNVLTVPLQGIITRLQTSGQLPQRRLPHTVEYALDIPQ